MIILLILHAIVSNVSIIQKKAGLHLAETDRLIR